MQIQRTLPDPEDIVAFAADHLPYQLPAMASLAHDLLDGYAALRQSQDGRIGLLATQIALVLEAFGGCEQFGIDRGRTDDGAYLAHRFADHIEEGPTCVLHASGRRPAPRAAGPLLPLRHIRRHDRGRRPRSWDEQPARIGGSRATDPAATCPPSGSARS